MSNTNRIGELKSAYFQVEMYNVVFMNVLHCLADLSHENWTSFFCKNEFVIQHSIKQFAAIDSVEKFTISLNRLPVPSLSKIRTTREQRKPFCYTQKHHRVEWFWDAASGSSFRSHVQHFYAPFGWERQWISPPNINSWISLCICKPSQIFL